MPRFTFIFSLLFPVTVNLLAITKADSLASGDTVVAEQKTIHIAAPVTDTVPPGLDLSISALLDSLTHITFYQNIKPADSNLINPYGFAAGEIPQYADSVYEKRMEDLNRETAFELSYNKQVRNFIDLYAGKRKGLTERMLGLSNLYFPVFEEHLDKYGLPEELKYLAMVESALNPTAVSKAGAKGLWQFMYGTGKLYGLKENSVVDDRFDVLKSTDAACRHLKDLYGIYGDWSLVLAAYNSGAGNVNKAIRRAGGVKSYWAVWPFLPSETRGYVPAFIAVAYLMNYPGEHNLIPSHTDFSFHDIDTVMTHDVVSLEQISEYLSIPEKDLKFLNPCYKTGIIPSSKDQKYPLHLPKQHVNGFIDHEAKIYAYKSRSGLEKEKLLAEIKKAKERNIHVVRSGESLSVIAGKYRCSVNQLRSWNNLKGNTIFPGQKLVLYAPGVGTTPSEKKVAVKTSASADGTHTVSSGESLGLIASKYGCSEEDLKKWNGLKNNTIHPNQVLYVKTPENTPAASATPQNNTNHSSYVYHTVKNGDTLWDIAKLYKGVSVEDIRKLNNLGNSSKLKPGQKLKISVKG